MINELLSESLALAGIYHAASTTALDHNLVDALSVEQLPSKPLDGALELVGEHLWATRGVIGAPDVVVREHREGEQGGTLLRVDIRKHAGEHVEERDQLGIAEERLE